MKQRLIVGLLIAILLLSGCSVWENAYEQAGSSSFNVVSTKAPSALGLIKAMEPGIKPQVRLGDTVQYTFEEDETRLYSRLMEGEADIAVVPTEMAAKLYNDGAGYQLAAVNTGGYIYVVTDDENIASFSDLKGKTVQIAGENSAADIVFRHLLIQNGIDPRKDLTLEYTSSAKEIETNIVTGKSDIVILPEPWISDILTKNSDFTIVLDIQEEWANIEGNVASLPQTCLIVKNEVASQNAEAWKLFLEDYKESIEWVNSNPAKTAELLDRHEVGIPKNLAEKVISRSNLEYADAPGDKQAVEKYLNTFLELSPESIGGKLPDAAFYHEKQ